MKNNGLDSTKIDEYIIYDTIFIKNPPDVLGVTGTYKEPNAIFYVVKQIKWNNGPFRGPEDPVRLPCTDRREDTVTIYGKRIANIKTEISITKHFCNTDTIVTIDKPIIFDKKQELLKNFDTVLSPNQRDIAFILQIQRKYDKQNRIIEEKHIVTDDGYLYNWYRYEYKTVQ